MCYFTKVRENITWSVCQEGMRIGLVPTIKQREKKWITNLLSLQG